MLEAELEDVGAGARGRRRSLVRAATLRRRFCNVKCAWVGQRYKNDFPWNAEPGNEAEWATATEVYGCLATPSTNIVSMNTCMPIDPQPYGSPAELVPTQDFAGSTTDQGNSVKIVVNGNPLTLDATLEAKFALYDCDQDGIDGGRCAFVCGAGHGFPGWGVDWDPDAF